MAKYFLNNSEITLRVVAIMERIGATKYKFAQSINMSRSTLTKIFTGKQNWTLDILFNVSEEYGVTLDYLVKGKEPSVELEELKRKYKTLQEHAEILRKNITVLMEMNKELTNV